MGQLGITHADQMRHPHRVEDARVCRVRRRQVGIPVEIDQTEVGLVTQQSGDDPQGHGASSTLGSGPNTTTDVLPQQTAGAVDDELSALKARIRIKTDK